MDKPQRWSPFERSKYVVMDDAGCPHGIGALSVFDDRPGLWNLVWLHSLRVDLLLEWCESIDQVPHATAVVDVCVESADYICGGMRLETLAECLTVQQFVARVTDKKCNPLIKQFWDEARNTSWENVVSLRLVNEPVKKPINKHAQKGNVFMVDFGCRR